MLPFFPRLAGPPRESCCFLKVHPNAHAVAATLRPVTIGELNPATFQLANDLVEVGILGYRLVRFKPLNGSLSNTRRFGQLWLRNL